MVDAAQRLVDFSQPVDVPLLESTVSLIYGAGSNEQRSRAERVLQTFQEHPEAWTRVDAILEHATSEHTKFFALQILESVIKYRWGALPADQREGIKNYISNLIIKYSTDEALFRRNRTFLSKLNVILVQILKQDWPHRWSSFIPDLVNASKTSESLCENSMVILKLLSEEVFDFSRGELTQAKTKELKNSLNNEFRLINELCEFVLMNTRKPELIRATLSSLHAYLSWVPPGYIFESKLIDLLIGLFPQPLFRNVALQCLTEVGSLRMGPEFDPSFVKFYLLFMRALEQMIPANTDIAAAYVAGTDEDQAFVQNLALFFTGFFKEHIGLLEQGFKPDDPAPTAPLLTGLYILAGISYVDDTEVFKTCLDYWNYFVPDVFSSMQSSSHNMLVFAFGPAPTSVHPRKLLYTTLLRKLRNLMIDRMAKPEEVIVVEDESGNIVRETMKDNDVLMQYRSMRETLVYLAHLDHEDTENLMLEKLRMQTVHGANFEWQPLNCLCWAVGSISGTMQDEQESRFLVTVIRDLLGLVELTRGKDNKAIIASNIMYVVGQYPKFLRAHWKFLKTVVNKLFEFMHELHPGVQDMACDTFLKICGKCRRKFVVQQPSEPEPFICELLANLDAIIQDLQPHHIHSFYEAVGLMIGAEGDTSKRTEYLSSLMSPANSTWQAILQQAGPDRLKAPEATRSLSNVLATNVAICSSLGHPYVTQMGLIFKDMLQVYRLYSELISSAILEGGPHAARSHTVKAMRGVKKVALRLIEAFADKCEDPELLVQHYVPAMVDPVLGDYKRSVPDARDAEVLSVYAAIINKLKGGMASQVPIVFEAVFESTLGMITRNFEDYPEHRLQFFSLLHAITNHCFACLFALNDLQLKLLIDSIVWAIRHTERNVAETGLSLLQDMLSSFADSEYATAFHQKYYLQLMNEIFVVMTDTFHKPGFKLHARILHHLFELASDDKLKAPLWDVTGPGGAAAYASNAAFVREYVTRLLLTSFPNMTPGQVTACVVGMFELREFSTFKHHLRDFLVQTKQFASQDNAELFAEEVAAQREAERQRLAAIPGMIPANEVQEEMVDT